MYCSVLSSTASRGTFTNIFFTKLNFRVKVTGYKMPVFKASARKNFCLILHEFWTDCVKIWSAFYKIEIFPAIKVIGICEINMAKPGGETCFRIRSAIFSFKDSDPAGGGCFLPLALHLMYRSCSCRIRLWFNDVWKIHSSSCGKIGLNFIL